MADIRIKDLTTLESASLTGDVFVIDGTTGTRKLSAFNPTFGGNATVTGTLTSNGSFAATGSMVSTYGTAPQLSIAPSGGRPIRFNASLGNISIQANSGGWYLGTHFLGSAGTHRGSIWASGTDDSLDFISIGDGSFSQWLSTSSTKIAIPLTTASTSTSSGALVVGNGTSGGLGVGGSVNIHNNLTLGYASAGDSILKLWRSQGGSEWLQITGWSGGSLGNNAYSIDAVNGASARPVYFRRSTDAGSTYTNFLTWDTSNNATFAGTITSTASTDSGLLQLNLVNSSTGTSASSLFRFNAGTRTATLQAYNDTHATLAGQLRIGTSNGDIVLIPSGVTAATFGASAISLGALNYTNTITGGDSGAGTSIAQFKDGVGSTKINFKGNGEVVLSASTASTTTSSGALVVSGGVGVGGAGFFGGNIQCNAVFASNNTTLYLRPQGATVSSGEAQLTTTGNLTLNGSVQTSAPAGGTAAAWKLGTVASVSPTSPNRTIEVDIGGTIYYIHAKTTNN